MHEGHRQRMLERLENGADSMQEHELLEILLYNAIPRKNTNEIAHELLLAFGSYENVLRASFAELKTVKGVGAETAAYLKCIGLLNKQMPCTQEMFPKGLNLAEIENFLIHRYYAFQTEVLELYCVDSHGRITHCQRFTDFRETSATVDMDKINKLFAAQLPAGILIAHNHPTAPCAPSDDDDRFTLQLMLYCKLNRIKLFDHVIIGIDGVYSYYRDRRIDEFNDQCNIKNFLDEKLKPRT